MHRGKKEGGGIVAVRRSRIAGRGVIALRAIRKGACVGEYKGARRKWSAYVDNADPYVCLFGVGRGLVIDPTIDGNFARYINHSCDPNCEAVQDGGRIFIESIRAIRPGEEITYDYNIQLDGEPTRAELESLICRCGAKSCRGTMLERSRPRRGRSVNCRRKTAGQPRRPGKP